MKRSLLALLLAAGACNLFYDPKSVPDPEADSGPSVDASLPQSDAGTGSDASVTEPDAGPLDGGGSDGGSDGSVPGPDAGTDAGTTSGAGAACVVAASCLDPSYPHCLANHCCSAASCWCTNSGNTRGQYAAATLATCETGACLSSGTSCGPYACDGAGKTCLTTCTRDHDCLAGTVCLPFGQCGNPVATGAGCERDPQCASGVCSNSNGGPKTCHDCRTDADCPDTAQVCSSTAGSCSWCIAGNACSGTGWGGSTCRSAIFPNTPSCTCDPTISPPGCGPRAPYCNASGTCQCTFTEPVCGHGQVCDSVTAPPTCRAARGFACLDTADCGAEPGAPLLTCVSFVCQ